MTRLVDALRVLGLSGEVELDGRWVSISGEHATVYVIESVWGDTFFTWCDTPGEQAIERYGSAVDAIRAGLRRAQHPPAGPSGGPPPPG